MIARSFALSCDVCSLACSLVVGQPIQNENLKMIIMMISPAFAFARISLSRRLGNCFFFSLSLGSLVITLTLTHANVYITVRKSESESAIAQRRSARVIGQLKGVVVWLDNELFVYCARSLPLGSSKLDVYYYYFACLVSM